MRIFLAGASGALGRQLIPALREAGHDVAGTTRKPDRAAELRAAGAEPVVLDALDATAVRDAVTAARPDVVMHQLTAISQPDFKNLDASFAATNRLRTEGLDHLLAAAREAGAKRFIAQSFTGWPNERSGSAVKTEHDRLDPSPAKNSERTIAAIGHVESAVTGADDIEGVVLRYGMFYGPGTDLSPEGGMLDMVRKRRLPVVGGGAGVFSFIHVADAATATVAAVENGAPGVYNIVDDDPAQAAAWLPYLADAIGAKPPRRLPAWLVKPMLGEFGTNVMTAARGSSNTKARRELGWTPSYPSWRDGFHALG